MTNGPSLIQAQLAASTLPPLLVEAERVAATIAQGIHGRRRTGSGDSFWQFRPYQSGEAAKRIDWRQSAKTQHHFVREYEWEAAQTVWFWRDASPSMSYSGSRSRPNKLRRAEILTLALASLLVNGGEQIALLGMASPPASGKPALYKMATLLEKHEETHALESLPIHEHLPRHGELVLIGDFLSPLDEIQEALKRYSRRHVRGHLLQVLDPDEESLPFEGRVNFEGMENEGKVYFGNVGAIREDYKIRLSKRREALRDLTHSLGWGFHRHTTDQSVQSALMALYLSITQGKV